MCEVAALRVRDVTTATDGSATVEFWQAKTARARTGYFRASTVRRLDTWRAAGNVDGSDAPLFPSMDRWGRVKEPRAKEPRAVADVIRKRAAAIGLRATGHSLRVGSAVSMASRGASLVIMQQAGGMDRARHGPPTTDAKPAPGRGPVATLRKDDPWARTPKSSIARA